MKPFLTNKGTHHNQAFLLRENDQIMRDERKVAEVMNKCFVNIVETVSGKKPKEIISCQANHETDQELEKIIKTFEDHPSVQNIRSSLAKIPNNFTEFKFKHATREDIVRIINELHDKTSAGIDDIPLKLVKIASEIISDPLTELINQTLITDLKFPCLEMIARVTPVFEKEDRMEKSNYRPISVLNVFSKVFERFLLNQMVPYLDNVLSTYLFAYRKGYSCQHVLLRLIEKWRQCLDQNKVVGAILIDLSKVFGALPHDVLTAKLNAYSFSKQALKLILSYLSGRRQCVKSKSLLIVLRLIKSGVPQGSILGPVLFNIFLNDIFLSLNDPDLHSFADDNTLSAVGETIQDLVDIMQHKAESATSWMEENNTIANPDKFKAIIITKDTQQTENYELNFKGKSISLSAKVDLLGITIDNKLSFEFHISEICRKAGGQLNALERLGSYLPPPPPPPPLCT